MAQMHLPKRHFFLDNLKIALIFLVVAFHSAQAYGPAGFWLFNGIGPVSSGAVQSFFVFFFAAIGAFFMNFFFFISGCILPASISRKGARAFAFDRLQRLGVPLLVFFFAIMPVAWFFLFKYDFSQVPSLADFAGFYVLEFHHLWFIALLLAFSLCYAAFSAWLDFSHTRISARLPRKRELAAFALFIGAVTFVVRVWSPLNEWSFLHLVEFAHFPQYASFFAAGIIAHRLQWLERFPERLGRLCLNFSALLGAGLFALLALAGGFSNPQNLFGGLTFESFAYSFWETAFAVCIVAGASVFFREHLDFQNRLTMLLSENVYAVYLLHLVFVIALQRIFYSFSIPVLAKFALVLIGAFAASVLLAHFVLRRSKRIGQLI